MTIEWDKIIAQMKLPLARPVHPQGILWVGGGAVLLVISVLAGWKISAFLLGLTAVLYVCFRDPTRVPPQAEFVAVAPADGILTAIARAPWPADMGMEGDTDVLTINPRFYDVHVLRSPVAGALTLTQHISGQWGSNVFDKAAPGNERAIAVMKLGDGRTIGIEVMGGAAPDRVKLSARGGDVLSLAQPVAYAAFGGEVRLYVSGGVEIIARVGQRMIAGETPIAALQTTF